MPNIQHKKSCLLLIVGYKGLLFLENVIDKINIAGVCSYQDNKSSDGCFETIIHKCKEASLPFREIRRVSSEDIKFYDLVFVVGWQFLLPLDGKIIVFHDSLLPRYRGFAPTVSALINGEKEIGVTAFSPDSGVDTGPIYDQMAVEIVYPITIKDALALQSRLTVNLALRIYEKLEKGLLKARKQDGRSATYSIWRDKLDFFINWKESSQRVLRTIDALGYPYSGAKAKIGDEVISITKASAVLPEKKFEIVNPGKVWSISDSGIEILTGTGSILLKEIADSSNKPFSLKKIRTRFEI